MKRRNIAIMAMLALTAGQAFAQRCLPQMKGIEVKVGMADGVYNGKKSCKAGYYAGLGLSSYTKGGDKWTYGAEYLQVHQPYRETSVPIAQITGEFGYSYNFLSDNSKTVLFYIGGMALAGYESVNWGKRTMSDGADDTIIFTLSDISKVIKSNITCRFTSVNKLIGNHHNIATA